MTLYIGDKPVGLIKVVKDTKYIDKTKYGVSIDNLLGNVDENGNYIAPTDTFVLDLTGVKHVPDEAFQYLFMGYDTISGVDMRLVGIIANDVTSVGSRAFYYISAFNNGLEFVHFDGLEEIITPTNGLGTTFAQAFHYAKSASFKSLKRLDNVASSSGGEIFGNAFTSVFLDFDSVFPSLEYVRGIKQFKKIFKSASSAKIKVYASKIHTCIQNGAGTYNPSQNGVFDSIYGDIYLPACTYAEGYLCRSATYKTVLHFAAAHQAELEACDGYDYMFGASEIYFDLMLNITVNGVVYSREYTIGGYTSWKDSDGNVVYTDATAEPAVGTVVYSDQGTTQVGTVSEVA